MSTPCSASIDDSAVSPTTTPESATDFFAGLADIAAGTLPSLESRPVAHEVVLIPGDGTGPELTEATRRVLEATGVEFDWDVREAGEEAMTAHGGNPLPEETLDAIRA